MDITLIKSPQGNITGAVYYTYNPSLPAAYIFMALFAVVTVAHFIYMFPLRSWYFTNFVLGGICETAGYYGRSKSHNNISRTGSWMLQNVMILGAPTFFAATVYMTLARLTIALGPTAERFSLISPRWLTKLYVLIDILCFLSQFAGAGVQASGNAEVISIGNKAILGGLIFQLVAFGFFILIAWKIERGFAAYERGGNNSGTVGLRGWRKYFRMLYFVSALFIVRNIMRAVEYGQIAIGGGGFTFATRGEDGVLVYEGERESRIGDHEVVLYVFDACMMFLVAVGFLALHPGRFIKRARGGRGVRGGREKLLSVDGMGVEMGVRG